MRTFHFGPDKKGDGDIEIPSPSAPWVTCFPSLLTFIPQVRGEGPPPPRGRSERMVSRETGSATRTLEVVGFFAKQRRVALRRRDSGTVSVERLVSGAGSPSPFG